MVINELTHVYMQLNTCTNKCVLLFVSVCVCVCVCHCCSLFSDGAAPKTTCRKVHQSQIIQSPAVMQQLCIPGRIPAWANTPVDRTQTLLKSWKNISDQVGTDMPNVPAHKTKTPARFLFIYLFIYFIKVLPAARGACGENFDDSVFLQAPRFIFFRVKKKNISSRLRLLYINGRPPHDCSLRICLVKVRVCWEKAEAWDCKTDWEVSLCFPASNTIWNRPVRVCCCLAGSPLLSFFFFALHTTGWLHVTQITVKSPHAQSFQLLNNTKQTVTYFRSREQAREKTWSGVRHGSGPREEQPGIRRRRGALTDRRRYWFVLVFRDRRRVRPEQKAWYAMWAPESDPAVLGVPDRGL